MRMKRPHICLAIAGLCIGASPRSFGQSSACDTCAHKTPANVSQQCPASDSSALRKAAPHAPGRRKYLEGIKVTGGQLTVPFKIRRKAEHGTFRLTTDVTLGAFVGLTKRLSEGKENYLTIPLTAGLTFVNINDNNTVLEFSAAAENGGTDVVPGLTWSSGLILQLDQYSLGLIFGKDYASEVGDQWLYHRKWWWSFGLGFSFTK